MKLKVYELNRNDLIPMRIGSFVTKTRAGEFINKRIEKKKINVKKVGFLLVSDNELFVYVSPGHGGFMWEKAPKPEERYGY